MTDETNPFGVARADRVRSVRQAVRQIRARTVALIVGTEYLDARDLESLVSDDRAVFGTPLLQSAYSVGRGEHEAMITADQEAQLDQLRAGADAAIRQQFGLIERAILASAGAGAIAVLVKAARNLLNSTISAEVVGAVNLGRAHAIAREHGPDSVVVKRLSPSACATCRAVHTNPDGTPRALKLSQLSASRGVSLTGRTAASMVIGPAHPGCMCILESAVGTTTKTVDPVALGREIELYKASRPGTRIDFQGIPIVIENAPGTVRHWRSETGREGTTTMLYAYGYIEGSVGGENEELDVFIGPSPTSLYVYVIHQNRPDTGNEGVWDEDKVMLGFESVHDATRAFLAHYNDPRFLGAVSMMMLDDFRARLPQAGGYIGSFDIAQDQDDIEAPKLIIKESRELMRSLDRDMHFQGPINGQWQDRAVETGGAGASLAVVTSAHISSADMAQQAGYRELAEDAAREKARWQIRIDPNILFMRRDAEAGRPVHPIKATGIAELADDLDEGFMRDVHDFIAGQAKLRTEAQALASPNVDSVKPEDEEGEENDAHVDQLDQPKEVERRAG